MLDYDKTRAWRSGPVRHTYTDRDTILYALGLGAGADALDPVQLRLVYEKELRALPTMAAVLASPGLWMRDQPGIGIDFLKLVHGEQSVVLHAPLPVAGTVVGHSRVVRIVDKGEGKGAIVHVEKALSDEPSGQLLATCEQVLFCRGDGGFSMGQGGDDPAPPAPATPDGPADVVVDLPIRPDAALLYRLSGDRNPLHVDPAVAAKAGFQRPILHGLATYGMAARAIVQTCAAGDPTRLRAIRARLAAPVYPGETLRVHAWRVGDEIALRGEAVERQVTVLSHGRARVGA